MRRRALMIGLFVIVALVLAAASIAFLGGTRVFEPRTRAILYFSNSVKGLYIGAPVTFRGVPIGQVDTIGIELDPTTLATHIPVQIALTPKLLRLSDGSTTSRIDVQRLVDRGLRGKLAYQSVVTGQAMIDLDFVPQAPPSPRRGGGKIVEIPVIKGQFDALVAQVSELPLKDTVQDLRKALAELSATARTANTVMQSLAQDWKLTTETARATVRQTDQTLQAVGTQANQTLKSVQALSDSSRELVLSTQPDIQLTLASSRQAAKAAETSFQSLAELSAPGGPVREDLEGTLRDLAQTARSLRHVAEVLENRPNALLFGEQ